MEGCKEGLEKGPRERPRGKAELRKAKEKILVDSNLHPLDQMEQIEDAVVKLGQAVDFGNPCERPQGR